MNDASKEAKTLADTIQWLVTTVIDLKRELGPSSLEDEQRFSNDVYAMVAGVKPVGQLSQPIDYHTDYHENSIGPEGCSRCSQLGGHIDDEPTLITEQEHQQEETLADQLNSLAAAKQEQERVLYALIDSRIDSAIKRFFKTKVRAEIKLTEDDPFEDM